MHFVVSNILPIFAKEFSGSPVSRYKKGVDLN
jgi:hypothetical protein